MRWKSHVRFGGRAGETDRWQQRHGAPVRSHLANAVVDDIRRRTQQSTLGHRGHKDDPLYRTRRLMTRGFDVTRLGGSGTLVLPAGYVAEHVDLAYASTAHKSQGRTVDTGHAMVSPTTTREVLYVSATRGRESNRLYVDTHYDPEPETGHDAMTDPLTAREVLAGVLRHEGADVAAHSLALLHDGKTEPPVSSLLSTLLSARFELASVTRLALPAGQRASTR